MQIVHKENENKVLVLIDETEAGVLRYTIHKKYWSADSVVVSPDFRGQGIAGQLLNAFVEILRAKGVKMLPVCSYVVKKSKESTEYDDVLYKEN
ncbi:MAG: GNAT family N-acetyltransferase [Eubacteriales bacterium]|nr:GNAT family N-acetyltransferase [Eubacteriales bacterium]